MAPSNNPALGRNSEESVMEYIRGVDLNSYLKKRRVLKSFKEKGK